MPMHADEIASDAALVKQMVAAQFPRWAHLPVRELPSAGTDNAIYRLGDSMIARLPRMAAAVLRLHKEQMWLPRLAPLLPLPIPQPIAAGEADALYPLDWAIYGWLAGATVSEATIRDQGQLALDLAQFIQALHAVDLAGDLLAGEHNFGRGVPLAQRDAETRAAIDTLGQMGMIDVAAAHGLWSDALAAPVHDGPPVWIHGDLQAGNLLARDGHLSAVIDFGGLGRGDPACDMQVAWSLLDADTRPVFRAVLNCDEAQWGRGQGWALSVSVIALPYYHKTNLALASIARRALAQLLGER